MQANLRMQHKVARQLAENAPEVQPGYLRSGVARQPSRSSTVRDAISTAQQAGQACEFTNELAPGLPLPERLSDLLHRYVRTSSSE